MGPILYKITPTHGSIFLKFLGVSLTNTQKFLKRAFILRKISKMSIFCCQNDP